MANFPDTLRIISLTLWVGGLWIVGALVAPLLFHSLPHDRVLAGALAGRIFIGMAWVGLLAGFYLLLYALISDGFGAFKQTGFWIVLLMLLLTAVNHFAIHPWITELKSKAGNVATGAFGGGFATAHTISSIIYLGECLLGLALITRGNK
ncbi:hypothetical protein HNQ59_002508 [Chitinivorax tropicus]|uniref:TMEM205-like domain-containing protein n=1 Tax=Chitinivorax tropicus TaxID=714531 RepID=A0A840MLC6_9PROT|nr:DUF4149 domain-containing protein [Chitinivorax tropicus]MBB5019210.1 hypothetical protein [Chitinivorax tropicus]